PLQNRNGVAIDVVDRHREEQQGADDPPEVAGAAWGIAHGRWPPSVMRTAPAGTPVPGTTALSASDRSQFSRRTFPDAVPSSFRNTSVFGAVEPRITTS